MIEASSVEASNNTTLDLFSVTSQSQNSSPTRKPEIPYDERIYGLVLVLVIIGMLGLAIAFRWVNKDNPEEAQEEGEQPESLVKERQSQILKDIGDKPQRELKPTLPDRSLALLTPEVRRSDGTLVSYKDCETAVSSDQSRERQDGKNLGKSGSTSKAMKKYKVVKKTISSVRTRGSKKSPKSSKLNTHTNKKKPS